MGELKVSVSGIRGIWGDSLTLESLADYTRAYGSYILKNGGNRVLIGRDARPTGKLIVSYTASILNAMGIDTVDIGIVPTPTVLFGVRQNSFDGGLIITASHNPVQWNALKFVKRGGVFTTETDLAEILSFLGKPLPEAAYTDIGHHSEDGGILKAHVEHVVNSVNAEQIRSKHFRVLLDPVNSAGGPAGRMLLEALGCEAVLINEEINGTFGRGSEPTRENLTHMKDAVLTAKASAGFAQDPDADRLVVADEKGTVLSEEWTLALALDNVLSKASGRVVVNLSTSMICEYLAAQHHSNVTRTKVGEANVVEGIQKLDALIGGEGNGGVIFPAINTARDSLAGIALVLEMMAERGKTLSEITSAYPDFKMKKEKFDFSGDLNALLSKVKSMFPAAMTSEIDGLRLEWKENGHTVWIHLRASNTEPVIRLIGESDDDALIRGTIERVRTVIQA